MHHAVCHSALFPLCNHSLLPGPSSLPACILPLSPALFSHPLAPIIFFCVQVGTLTGLQWGIYDAYKVSVGLPTTGSVAHVEVRLGLGFKGGGHDLE